MKCWARLLILTTLTLIPTATLSAAPKDKKQDPEQIGKRDVGKGVNFYSLEREISLGKQLAEEIERQARVIDDPIPSEFVNRLAKNLAHNSDIQVPVTAKLIDSSEVNAFALPGGFLFVNTALILKAESEAELAGVMAHEIAHVAARHGTRQASRGQLLDIASLPLIFMGGWAGYAIRQGAGIAVPVAFLKFSRSFEREADLLGLQYVYKSGYDPSAFIDLLERLEAMEKTKPGTVSELFRDHPNVASRIQSTQKNIEQLLAAHPQYVLTTSEFQDVKAQLTVTAQAKRATPEKKGPTLRRKGEREDGSDSTKPDQDERPTLKRRDS